MKPMLVTISREYGSGGREIAQRLSEQLDMPVFDRRLIDLTADHCGFSTKFIQENEERMNSSFLFNIAVSGAFSPMNEASAVPQDYVFISQSKIIKMLAEEHPRAIFVGRCADHILRDHKDLLSVFITADMEFRMQRAVEVDGVKPEKAYSVVSKHDKHRRRHYNYYTGREWGARSNYDLIFNTGRLGTDTVTALMANIIQGV